MTINKRSKNSRFRGSHTHGWGAKKKHRGAGNRGGKGNSSTGARSDAKKPSVWGIPGYFGKRGFKKKNIPITHVAITIKSLEENAKRWEHDKKIKTEAGALTVDLGALGYTKLLATGHATRKWKILVQHAVPNAVEKIKEAGGSVEGLATAKE